ncbi:MAG: cobalt-precorrin-5B (C(1))-methyltransferase CbiD [Armatimonadota bacterium]
MALHGDICHAVEVTLPDGATVILAIEQAERLSPTVARASVVKDAGDDPDITDGMLVATYLELGGEGLRYCAGDGVGVVTRPGLQIAPGEPAINPVPRALIAQAIRDVLGDVGCTVTVSIPGGAEVAQKTFNPRLGIEGGLSVLGTSGRVMPKSEEAWLRSLVPQIDVALAAGERTLYLVPGGFGEQAAREALGAPPITIVQTSNFIGDMLRACTGRGVERVVLVGHVGKLVKVAAGLFNTHSRFGDARLETVAAMAAAEGAPGPLVARLLALPTSEAAIGVLSEAGLHHVWDTIAQRAADRATQHAGLPVSCALIGYEREIIGRNADLRTTVPGDSPIIIAGVGPGAAALLTPAAWQAIRQAEVIVGGQRQLAECAPASATHVVIGAEMAPVMEAIRAQVGRRVVVLASGDPSCYGILATLRRALPELSDHFRVIPGISAMQLALARLGESWEGVQFTSAHGRSVDGVIEDVRTHARVLAFTDHHAPAEVLARALAKAGLAREVVVLERLGYADERITRGTVAEIADGAFHPLAAVWIETR